MIPLYKYCLMLVFGVSLLACQSQQQSADRAHIAQIRTAMAGQYLLVGQLDEAKRQLDVAMAADADFAPSHDMMGVLLQSEGSAENLQLAEGYFLKAIQLDPNFMRAYNNYGVYLSQMGRTKEALTYFERAGSSLGYEGRIQALENLGRTWQKLGDRQRVQEAFSRAVHGGSTDIEIYQWLIDEYMVHGQYREADLLFKRLIALTSLESLTPKLLSQGIQLARFLEDEPRAEQMIQLLRQRYPQSAESMVHQ